MKILSQLASQMEVYTEVLDKLRPTLRDYDYAFMSGDEYFALSVQSIGAGNRVYIQEILFRAHFGALTAVLRQDRWMRGLRDAAVSGNYFVFCACLRGFLESAADTFDGLWMVPHTLAKNFAIFQRALQGRLTVDSLTCAELESALIHLSYARRLPKDAQVEKSHQAKTMRDYLQVLEDEGSTALLDLYGELCELTHPAAATIHFFLGSDPEKPGWMRLRAGDDVAEIRNLVLRHDAPMPKLFGCSFDLALMTLWVLNQFSDPRIFTIGLDEAALEILPAVRELRGAIRQSGV